MFVSECDHRFERTCAFERGAVCRQMLDGPILFTTNEEEKEARYTHSDNNETRLITRTALYRPA